MKTKACAAAVAGLFLAGCEPAPPTPEEVEAAAQSVARVQLSQDEQELKENLARLQAADPRVKDLYYGVDEAGNRVVHVVREGDPQATPGQEVSASSYVWPLLGGMVLGGLVSQMVSRGGPTGYASYTPPYRTTSYISREDERKDRNRAVSGYSGQTVFRSRAAVREAAARGVPPSAMSRGAGASKPMTSVPSRSSGVFKSGSSSRSGAYGRGG